MPTHTHPFLIPLPSIGAMYTGPTIESDNPFQYRTKSHVVKACYILFLYSGQELRLVPSLFLHP